MKAWISILILCLALTHAAQANEKEKIQALDKEIKQLQEWLNSAQKELDKLNQNLRTSDIEVNKLTKQIEETRAKLQHEQSNLKKLKAEQGQLNELQTQHRRYLAEQIRAAQRLGQDSPIKLLLNQSDPQQAQRMLRFFAYFNQARIEQIQTVIADLERLDNLAKHISQSEQSLKQTEQELLKRSQQRQQQKHKQQQLLTQLRQNMSGEKQRLERKEADRAQLEKLLKQVEIQLQRQKQEQAKGNFAQQKGKLSTPVAGRVIKTYNPAVRHEGWLISAPEGTAVHAVHKGRVVFSDWLRGYGLITILDHGQGYLSLYAHNQSLLKSVGNWVNQGEVIATVGQSGGGEQDALYFEIRQNGRPQNPGLWLKR
ncbi:MAG: peptidoglycan DD-metalloendopeptidase family protein [Venatoribacter sp.]